MPGEHRKRDFNNYVKVLKNGVLKKYQEKQIISYAGIVKVSSGGEFDGIENFGPPKTPLDKFLNRPDIIEGLNKAAEETFYQLYDDPIDDEEEFDRVHLLGVLSRINSGKELLGVKSLFIVEV